MAAFLHAEHRDETVTARMAEDFAAIVSAGDEPFADSSLIPFYYLSKMARRHVTVALGGDGGDEIFGGYETYVADQMHARMRAVPRGLVRAALALYEGVVPASRGKVSTDYKIRQFLAGHALGADEAHYFWREIARRADRESLIDPAFLSAQDAAPFDVFARHAEEACDLSDLDRAMYVDLKTWLVDDVLVKVDRATMAHGLEARAPFLDHRMVSFAAALPVEMKIAGARKKIVLRESQRDRLPADVLRRRKRGFNAPVAHWTDTLGDFLGERILGGVIQRPAVERLIDEHRARRRDNGLRLLALAVLSVWETSVLATPPAVRTGVASAV